MSAYASNNMALSVAGISATAEIGEILQRSGGFAVENSNSNDDSDVLSDSDKKSDDHLTDPCSLHSGSEGEEHTTPDYVPGCFEGPEKTMEVTFKPDVGMMNGLRCLNRDQLDTLCTQAKCTILSKISNSHLDAYVLSESSLFVYKHKFIMKTCGTTTLLRCLSTLLQVI